MVLPLIDMFSGGNDLLGGKNTCRGQIEQLPSRKLADPIYIRSNQDLKLGSFKMVDYFKIISVHECFAMKNILKMYKTNTVNKRWSRTLPWIAPLKIALEVRRHFVS